MKKKRTKTAAEIAHLDKVAALGCWACRKIGYEGTPAEIHHIRTGSGTGQRSSHFNVIPLCPHHHRTGGHGQAFHAGQKTWQERFGYELDLVEEVIGAIK